MSPHWCRLRRGRNATQEVTFAPVAQTADDAMIRMMSTNVRSTGPAATLVDASAIDAQPWHDLDGFENVSYKLLWRSGKSVAGIMRIAPDGRVDPHVHQRSHHHMWVLDGSAELLGQRVGKGSYLHVPAGVEHGITAPGPGGCTVLYLYLREDADRREGSDA